MSGNFRISDYFFSSSASFFLSQVVIVRIQLARHRREVHLSAPVANDMLEGLRIFVVGTEQHGDISADMECGEQGNKVCFSITASCEEGGGTLWKLVQGCCCLLFIVFLSQSLMQ